MLERREAWATGGIKCILLVPNLRPPDGILETKSFKSPRRKRDLSPIWNLDINS